MRYALLACLIGCCTRGWGQQDTVVLHAGDVLVGEIKTLSKGVLQVKTPYSKEDFKIKWKEVGAIHTDNLFLISSADGRRINGSIHTYGLDSLAVYSLDSARIGGVLSDIVFLRSSKSRLVDRIDFDIDLGFNYNKANNLNQFSLRSKLSFLTMRADTRIFYNANRSLQDGTDKIRRVEAGVNYKWYLQQNWFGILDANFLSNTEQALKLRSSGRGGIGKFIFYNKKAYWGVGSGMSFNNEQFANDLEDRNSIEAFIASELLLFDMSNLSLSKSVYMYPSLTDPGRFRLDLKFDLKYDLPGDFYIKTGINLNYDNRPAVAGKETDYILFTTVGWSL